MARPQSSNSDDTFAIDRLQNNLGAAEGTNLPPRQHGELRVPFVTNLRIIRTEQIAGQTRFTLAWDEPVIPNLSRFNVYVTAIPATSVVSSGPFTVQDSPAIVSIQSDSISRLAFTVQTVLNNGLTSIPFSGPTCTGIAVA